MALFSRKVPLIEAARALRADLLEGGVPRPLPPELEDLARMLRHHDADGPPSQPGFAAEPPGDQLQELLDALPEAAGVLDPKGKLVRTNAALDALFGAGRSLGRTLLEATRSAELAEAGTRALAGGSVKRELPLPALQKIVLAALAPISGERALVVLRDLTEPKRAEAIRRDFVANASHELRTPVSAISGAVETLLSEGIKLDAPARSFAEMIARHSARLSRLTQDLLDLSRLESGEWKVELGAVEVAPICESVVELVRARAEARRVAIGVDVPGRLRVLADRRALEQILVNLLDNAIKFAPEGGRVTLLADGPGQHVVISVIDTGQGIEPRHLPRLFERFYRVDSGRSREAGGTGLGLTIVKHLAVAQGGEVGVESGQGGSRFWVKLKAAAPGL